THKHTHKHTQSERERERERKSLINAFITLCLDYCNALLSGWSHISLKSLKLIQNAAARPLTRTQTSPSPNPFPAALFPPDPLTETSFLLHCSAYPFNNNFMRTLYTH